MSVRARCRGAPGRGRDRAEGDRRARARLAYAPRGAGPSGRAGSGPGDPVPGPGAGGRAVRGWPRWRRRRGRADRPRSRRRGSPWPPAPGRGPRAGPERSPRRAARPGRDRVPGRTGMSCRYPSATARSCSAVRPGASRHHGATRHDRTDSCDPTASGPASRCPGNRRAAACFSAPAMKAWSVTTGGVTNQAQGHGPTTALGTSGPRVKSPQKGAMSSPRPPAARPATALRGGVAPAGALPPTVVCRGYGCPAVLPWAPRRVNGGRTTARRGRASGPRHPQGDGQGRRPGQRRSSCRGAVRPVPRVASESLQGGRRGLRLENVPRCARRGGGRPA